MDHATMQLPTLAPPASHNDNAGDGDTRPTMPFRFMGLPTEIRLLIYAELVLVGKVFCTPTTYELNEGARFKEYKSYRTLELQILRVSKQIHKEAEELYLSRNLFVLPYSWNQRSPLSGMLRFQYEYVPTSTRPLFSEAALGHLRHISMAIGMRSEESTILTGSFWTQALLEGHHTFFNSRTAAQRMGVCHGFAKDWLQSDHSWLWTAVAQCDGLNTLEVDVSNAHCPLVCCCIAIFNNVDLDVVELSKLRVIGLHRGETVE